MKKICWLPALFVMTCAWTGWSADWLNEGGDPQRSGWQKREAQFYPANISELKLLWKRRLDNRSKGLNSLTAPVILGPIITHRGIKELIFIAGASDNVYAVDVDRGTVFWKRHIETAAAPDQKVNWPCGAGLTAAPAIGPAPRGNAPSEDDPGPMRPLYVLASDGMLHTIRISTGEDAVAPVKFIPANANASSLNLAGNSIYTTTLGGCGAAPDGVWAIDATAPGAKASFFSLHDGSVPDKAGVSIGPDGTVYAAFTGKLADTVIALTPATLKRKDDVAIPIAGSSATWQDTAGTRWIYAAARNGSIAAFKVTGTARQPELEPVWTSRDLIGPVSPVIVNGIVFALSSGEIQGAKPTHATLYALDAATGKELFSSGNAVTSFTHSSALAVANGHVCFATFDNTLYCFGFPIEI